MHNLRLAGGFPQASCAAFGFARKLGPTNPPLDGSSPFRDVCLRGSKKREQLSHRMKSHGCIPGKPAALLDLEAEADAANNGVARDPLYPPFSCSTRSIYH